MIFQKSLLVALLSLCSCSVDSFVIRNPSSSSSSVSTSTLSSPLPSPFQQSSTTFTTCLHEKQKKKRSEAGEEEVSSNDESSSEEETVAAGDDSTEAATDILNSPAFLSRKLEVLKSDVEKIEEEIAAAKEIVEAGREEWQPQLEKIQNEFSNIQERMSGQNKQADEMATRDVVRDMLEVMDNFDRAFQAVRPETDEEIAIEAEYKAVYQSMLDTFDKLGVKQIETVGKAFDYEVHQAIMQRPSDEYEEGIVMEEYQKGFILGETLIRASMVAVAA